MVCSAGVMLFASCAGTNKLEKKVEDCAERISRGIELYHGKRYGMALARLEDARTQCSGSPSMDTVLFYLGMTNVKQKKFIEARTEFQRLVQDFPGSPFFDEAKFRIGYVVFQQSHPLNRDQKETREALRLLEDYVESYPSSSMIDSARFYRNEAYEKLALKEFKNAQFYEKIDEPEAAVVYYRAFLNQFPESKLVDQARFTATEILLRLDRNAEAEELRDELIERGKNKELQKKVKTLFPQKSKGAKTGK